MVAPVLIAFVLKQITLGNDQDFTNNSFTMSSSIGGKCTEIKQEYDGCFNKWYSEKFLRGDATPMCDDLFFKYKECLLVRQASVG